MQVPADLRLPSIDGLRAFEASARLGTFERAADELAVTASAVGKRVSTLEDLLGTALLLRNGKSLVPTVAGREYLSQVRGALGLLASMPLHRRTVQRQQRLRITAPPTFARQVLVPRLDDFAARHPQIELEIVLSVPFVGGTGSGLAVGDVEIVHGANAQARDDAERVLMHDRLLPLAAPALIARHGRPRRPADLARLPLLRTPIEPWRPWFDAAGLDWPEPASGPRLVDLGLTLEAAVCGQGVALARPSLALASLHAGALQPLFPLSVPAAQPYLLRPHAGDAAAGAFADWLLAICGERERAAQEWLSGIA